MRTAYALQLLIPLFGSASDMDAHELVRRSQEQPFVF